MGVAGYHIHGTIQSGSIVRDSENEIHSSDVSRLVNDMYKLVPPSRSQIIHVLPQSYRVDGQPLKNPVGATGVRVEGEFLVVTASEQAVANLQRCAERSDLNVVHTLVQPMASAMAVLNEQERQAGVALVDIGGGSTDIAIFYEGVMRHTSVIPFGGNILTSDIKQGCQIIDSYAERLKIEHGSTLAEKTKDDEVISVPVGLPNRPPKEISTRNLASIIEARMEEIVEMVHDQILSSGLENKLVGGIVLTGGGSQLKNLVPLFEYMTGLNVRVGYPSECLGEVVSQEVRRPAFATAVGLAAAGFQTVDYRFSQPKKTQRSHSGATRRQTSATASAGKSMGGLWNSLKNFLFDSDSNSKTIIRQKT